MSVRFMLFQKKKTSEYIAEEASFFPRADGRCLCENKSYSYRFLYYRLGKEGLRANIVFPSGIIGPRDYGRGSFTGTAPFFCGRKTFACCWGGYDFVDMRDVAEGLVQVAKQRIYGHEGKSLYSKRLLVPTENAIVPTKIFSERDSSYV